MGLAPQIVEEVFEIVRDLNTKERVTFLLAEQNTNIALKYADYGYILENGRVVIDGHAKDLRENEDVKEFTSGSVAPTARASARSRPTSAASAGWPEPLWRSDPMSDFYDVLETRHPAEREAALMAALPDVVAQARRHAPAYAALLADVVPTDIDSRAALAHLPVIRKSELLERQQALRTQEPFGGFSAIGWRGLSAARGARRVFQSPGPIYEPEGHATDYWRMARALWAAGFRSGDLAHCSFSYHLTPAGSMMEGGAHAIGCTTFPGGVGNTELQLQAVAELQPHAYIGTPSFLKILVEKAAETGVSVASITKALVSARRFRRRCAIGWPSAVSRATSATPPPIWASSPMKPPPAKGWCWTKG